MWYYASTSLPYFSMNSLSSKFFHSAHFTKVSQYFSKGRPTLIPPTVYSTHLRTMKLFQASGSNQLIGTDSGIAESLESMGVSGSSQRRSVLKNQDIVSKCGTNMAELPTCGVSPSSAMYSVLAWHLASRRTSSL